MAHKWSPISDYEVEPGELADPELGALSAVWKEQKSGLEGLEQFTERLKREWAIETGLIERLYDLDRGVTELLIERGIDAALIPHRAGLGDEKVAMIGDQKSAIESIFAFVKGDRLLSSSYVKELHALFTRNQDFAEGRDQFGRRTQIPLRKGDYKSQPNNPTRDDGTVHEYCPPEHVGAEMDRLMELHRKHLSTPPEVEAAWLHHRFAQIHPFQDGNGRVARALATLVFIQADWLPLVVRDAKRGDYIQALEVADSGDLRPLVSFFSALQKREFLNAISLAREVEREARVDLRIRGIGRKLAHRRKELAREWNDAVASARKLHDLADERMLEIRGELETALSDSPEFEFFVHSEDDQGDRSHWFRRQVISTAKELDYFANTDQHRAWVRLGINDAAKKGTPANVLISFHSIGHEFRGVLACSATWFERLQGDDDRLESTGERPLCADVFRINYKEKVSDIEPRFRKWLDEAIERGLARWQSTL